MQIYLVSVVLGFPLHICHGILSALAGPCISLNAGSVQHLSFVVHQF